MTRASDHRSVTVVEPPRGLDLPSIRELRHYRDLLYFLVRRDVAARYKQTAIGGAWAILQPVLLAAIFSVFFGLLAKVPSQAGIPYPLFAVSGMVMWLFFSTAMTNASESTVASSELISKVYFPRVVIPVAAVIPPAIDFALGFIVVLVALFAYGFVPEVKILLLPFAGILALGTALGLGLWLSALHVKYRDVHIAVPLIVMVGLFITPIVYPFSLVPDNLQWLYALNPMVGVLEAYRWMLFPDVGFPGLIILIPVAASIVLLVSGFLYFHRAERSFADVI